MTGMRYRVDLPERKRNFLQDLKNAVKEKAIRGASVQHLEFKGQNMVCRRV